MAPQVPFTNPERPSRAQGPQDSFASAYGGLSHITIASSGLVEVTPVLLHADSVTWINNHLLLFDAGGTHDASTLAQSVRLGSAEVDRIAKLHAIRDLTGPFREAMAAGTTDQFGPLLGRHWELKAGLGVGISTPRADALLAAGSAAGADGGKLVGAGGGGYVLVSVPRGALGPVRSVRQSMGFNPAEKGPPVRSRRPGQIRRSAGAELALRRR